MKFLSIRINGAKVEQTRKIPYSILGKLVRANASPYKARAAAHESDRVLFSSSSSSSSRMHYARVQENARREDERSSLGTERNWSIRNCRDATVELLRAVVYISALKL